MRILIVLSLLLWGLSSKAEVCITDVRMGLSSVEAPWDQSENLSYKLYQASLTCQQIDNISAGLSVTSIALQAGALTAACTGVGLSATLFLEGGAIFLSAVDLIVSNLDCVDLESEAELQTKIDESVCQALQSQGVQCHAPIPIETL